MTRLTALFRLLLVAALAAGLALPAVAGPLATAAPVPAHACHDDSAAAPAPASQDEACRQHCHLAPLLVPPASPVTCAGRATPLRATLQDGDAPSRWPPPEGRPPRA